MHKVWINRTSGKGQAQPGPSLAMSALTWLSVVVGWLVLSMSAAGRFVFETSTVGHLDERAVVGASAIAAGLLVGLVYVPSGRRPTTSAATSATLISSVMIASAAALSTAVAPLIVFANRYSDAPKGSVVLFWTVVVAGVALWLAGALERRQQVLLAPGAVLAMTGAMGVLANWERPSSFSLLSRYAAEQLLMGAASVIWALSIYYIVRRVRADGWTRIAAPFTVGSILAGTTLVLASANPGDAFVTTTLLAAACAALVAFLTLTLAASNSIPTAASALVFAPVLVSAITFIESALGMRGPRPLLATEVLAASLVCVTGALLVWRTSREPRFVPGSAPADPTSATIDAAPHAEDASLDAHDPATDTVPTPPTTPSVRLARWLSAAALLLTAVALIMPAVAVRVRGVREAGSFTADFHMRGYETVGGWLVLSLALVVLAMALRPLAGNVLRGSLALGAGLLGWWVLRFIPLHTWISWIPPEVQQDYGSEYASIVFAPMQAWWQVAALIVAGAGASILLWNLYGTRNRPVR
ncbi:MAG: hypothetical protein ACYC6C_00170 [Coriobacteriia bacterium]